MKNSKGTIWRSVFFHASILMIAAGYVSGTESLAIVVLSQEDRYHNSMAQHLKRNIEEQANEMNQEIPTVYLTHKDFVHPGAWTVIPILSQLNALHGTNCSWIIFCESHTHINLFQMLQLLSNYSSSKELLIGHALYDREATIIHHFAFSNDPEQFKYPHFAAGFAMSQSLLNRIASRLENGDRPNIDFSIDSSHELALYIWNNGVGPVVTHSPQMCLKQASNCASYPLPFQLCNEPVNKESIYFAVKTCKKFYKDRIPVIKNTWGKFAVHIGFYSEDEDSSIPTIDVGVPNTEHGHCGKTMAILKHIVNISPSIPDIRWVVIADDDTILSVTRLQQLLSCYDSRQALAIGERYGYNVLQSAQGYNYITGGGGMVFSIACVHKIVSSKFCKCPSNSTPDDMFLGICLSRLGVAIIHSSSFHQARPSDYAPEYLSSQLPVSFHKHWMVDPLQVYRTWFSEVDQNTVTRKHVEL